MADGWLSLKVTDKADLAFKTKDSQVRISVPKKVVPLATQRNRIKRLIREVVRQESFLKDPNKFYFFKVIRRKSGLDLKATLKEIDLLTGR